MNNKEIILVAGLTRTGTSLVCQMLAAAGIPVAGDYPSFEPDQMMSARPDPAFLESCQGGAVKLLEPHRTILPRGGAYRILLLSRSKRQQALSSVKFMVALDIVPKGKSFTEKGLDAMRESLSKDQVQARKELQSHGCPILRVSFEEIITEPEITASKIADFLGIDQSLVVTMVGTIRPRPHGAKNYPGLLEVELMQELEEKTGKAPAYDPLQCSCKFPGVVAPCPYCRDGDYSLEENVDVLAPAGEKTPNP